MALENIGKTGFARGSLLRDSPISGSFVNLCPHSRELTVENRKKYKSFTASGWFNIQLSYNFKTENARKLGSLI